MSTHFKNAPLVELIVELRWDEGEGAPQVPTDGTMVPLPVSAFAEPTDFYRQFQIEADRIGYHNSEHLLPPGMPAVPGQVSRRFRVRADDPILMQVGRDVFSVNALPPYRSWSTFSDKVQTAVEALIAARGASGELLPFTSATIRYIDAFDSRFTKGRPAAEFITEVLGFAPRTPSAIADRASAGTLNGVALQYAFTTVDDLRVQLSVGDGQAGASRAVVYDCVVGQFGTIAPNTDEVMRILDAAHEVAHEMFLGVTESLTDIMEPEEGAAV